MKGRQLNMTKRIISLVTALLMALLIPANLNAAALRDADLDAALNVDGGTLTFVSNGAYPWQAEQTDEEGHASFGVSGNAGVASSVSVMTAEVNVGEDGGSISFDFIAGGESSNYGTVFDHCIFKIDGVSKFDKGNEFSSGWQSFSANLEPGAHTLLWSYEKDGSVNSDSDCFKVDNVAVGGASEPDPTPTPEPPPEPPTDEELDNALNAAGGSIHFTNDELYPWQVFEDAGILP